MFLFTSCFYLRSLLLCTGLMYQSEISCDTGNIISSLTWKFHLTKSRPDFSIAKRPSLMHMRTLCMGKWGTLCGGMCTLYGKYWRYRKHQAIYGKWLDQELYASDIVMCFIYCTGKYPPSPPKKRPYKGKYEYDEVLRFCIIILLNSYKHRSCTEIKRIDWQTFTKKYLIDI